MDAPGKGLLAIYITSLNSYNNPEETWTQREVSGNVSKITQIVSEEPRFERTFFWLSNLGSKPVGILTPMYAREREK